MSEELPKYLKNRALYQPRMLAVVKKDNVASCKVLEKNGFIKFGNFDEEFLYIAALDLTKEIKAFQKEVLKNYAWQKGYSPEGQNVTDISGPKEFENKSA